MGCSCRLLLALLLLPAGLGDDSTASPLAPTSPPFSSEGILEVPVFKDAAVPTPAPGQPLLSVSTGPDEDRMSSGPLEGDDHNATSTAALPPTPVPFTTSSITTADSPSVASTPGLVPSTLETTPDLWTANTATSTRGTTDLGTAPSPPGVPTSPSSSLPSADLYSSPETFSSPTPVLTNPRATQTLALAKDVPSVGTMALASSLATEPKFPPVTVMSSTAAEATTNSKTTLPTGVIMEEVPRALSTGSIVAITMTVIVVVVLVFGAAAYLKIRHSSYGRLLDDHDYGSWGNYNNPLYDDS